MTQPLRRAVGTFEGETVEEVVLTSASGVSVAILTYGALVRDWRVPVAGVQRSVVLGFDDFAPYPDHSPYFGAIPGRVANRIGGARFTLEGREHILPANEGDNHLHGGPRGMGTRVWTIADHDGQSVTLIFFSPDGDMGYPGDLEVSVTYRLSGHRLDIAFDAEASAPTPVNLTQHNYFNLSGEGDVLDHRLALGAGAHVELGAGQIPTGAILPVAGTALDFRSPRTLRDARGEGIEIDGTFVLDTRRDISAPAAVLTAPDGSLTLKLFTDQNGVQVYNGWKLDIGVPGLGGRRYERFSGICLEDQNFPDAINHPHFPDCVIGPGAPYRHRCAIEIA